MAATLKATKRSKQTTQNEELSSKEAESPKEASSSTKSSPNRRSKRILTRNAKGNETSPDRVTLNISRRTNAGGSQLKKSPKAKSSPKSVTSTRVSGKSAAAPKRSKTIEAQACAPSSKNLQRTKKTSDLDLLSPHEGKRPRKQTEEVAQKGPKNSPIRISPRTLTRKSEINKTSPNEATLSISGRTDAGGNQVKESPKTKSSAKSVTSTKATRKTAGRNQVKKSPKASSSPKIVTSTKAARKATGGNQVKKSPKAKSSPKSVTSTRVSGKSVTAPKRSKTIAAKACAPSRKNLKIPKKTSDLDLLSPHEAKRPKENTEEVAKKALKSSTIRTSPRRLTRKSEVNETSPNGTPLTISARTIAGGNQVKKSPKASSSLKSDKGQSATSTRASGKSAAAPKKRKANPARDCAPPSKKVKMPRKTPEKAQVNNTKAKSELKNEDIEERLLSPPKRRKRSAYQSEAFKRYGVIVPSIEEMLAEKNSLVSYRQHVEEAQRIEEPTFVWPSLPERVPFSKPMLDCKSLTLDELTEQFNLNVGFLDGVSAGKTYSERHQRYHNSNQWQNKFTLKDLTYNTSTIVFSFEQVDLLATLIGSRFPDQSKYVFQVLLPDLCLKIFMNQHDMSKMQAKRYLDMRPVE